MKRDLTWDDVKACHLTNQYDLLKQLADYNTSQIKPTVSRPYVPPVEERLISVTAGGRHAWYETRYGRVRRPLGN